MKGKSPSVPSWNNWPGSSAPGRGPGGTPYRLHVPASRGRPAPGPVPDPAAIPGLAWRRGAETNVNPPAPPLRDLDTIPFPYQEDLDATGNELSQRTVYYETSRGCPFACGFCLSSTTEGLRYFSLERVRDDLERLLKAGVREIKFVDRTFNAHKKSGPGHLGVPPFPQAPRPFLL